MDKGILRRLSRIEAKAFPSDGVGLLELQADGSWTLTENGKTLGSYATEADGVAAFRRKHLIIDDI